MKDLWKVLYAIFVDGFYRAQAGFFLVVGGLCFGFMSGVEHKALAGAFISSYFLISIPVAAWLFYAGKVILSNRRELGLARNQFLLISILSGQQKLVVVMVIGVLQFLPAILYGAFLIITALENVRPYSAIMVALALIALTTVISISLARLLRAGALPLRFTSIINFLDKNLVKRYVQFFPEWILRREPGLVYGTKIVSGLLLYGILQLYNYDEYDGRLAALGCVIVAGINLSLVFQYHRFENYYFQILRNMPITSIYRIVTFLIVFVFLCLPEFALLATYYPKQLTVFDYISDVIFIVSLIALGYGSLFTKDITSEKFAQRQFVVTIAWIFLILFSIPLLVGAAIHFVIGFFLLHRYFYGFEYNADLDSAK